MYSHQNVPVSWQSLVSWQSGVYSVRIHIGRRRGIRKVKVPNWVAHPDRDLAVVLADMKSWKEDPVNVLPRSCGDRFLSKPSLKLPHESPRELLFYKHCGEKLLRSPIIFVAAAVCKLVQGSRATWRDGNSTPIVQRRRLAESLEQKSFKTSKFFQSWCCFFKHSDPFKRLETACWEHVGLNLNQQRRDHVGNQAMKVCALPWPPAIALAWDAMKSGRLELKACWVKMIVG